MKNPEADNLFLRFPIGGFVIFSNTKNCLHSNKKGSNLVL
jgi:hypothetical protein